MQHFTAAVIKKPFSGLYRKLPDERFLNFQDLGSAFLAELSEIKNQLDQNIVQNKGAEQREKIVYPTNFMY